jgi:catechol 2,3-dioxygenase-like lactoylglutathione lyase family enzyme
MTDVAQQLVKGTDFVFLATRDWKRAVDFYGRVLGLPILDYEKIPGGEFETGNLTLQVVESAAIGRDFERAPNPVALHVDDVEAARAELESRGVQFQDQTIDSGVCHMAFFQDPDGNQLCLHHRYAPRTTKAAPLA